MSVVRQLLVIERFCDVAITASQVPEMILDHIGLGTEHGRTGCRDPAAAQARPE
ncbi:MAG: hypothetical protein IT384_01460 [Deltaproteobacteria bacterium]|nr:hypothetical protein [Deltaproteobacteria bacterium]